VTTPDGLRAGHASGLTAGSARTSISRGRFSLSQSRGAERVDVGQRADPDCVPAEGLGQPGNVWPVQQRVFGIEADGHRETGRIGRRGAGRGRQTETDRTEVMGLDVPGRPGRGEEPEVGVQEPARVGDDRALGRQDSAELGQRGAHVNRAGLGRIRVIAARVERGDAGAQLVPVGARREVRLG
jgi:hypothetical protein